MTTTAPTGPALTTLAALTLVIAACGGDAQPGPTPTAPNATSSSTGTSGTGGNATSGRLTINLTDSPFSDAQSLLVTFSEVSVHQADPGEWRTVPFASGVTRTCDLKKLNGATDVLGIGTLPAGHYTQVRLTVSRAELFFEQAAAGPSCAATIARPGGRSAEVEVPSGEVRLVNEFRLSTAGTTMLLDFDGDQSVRQIGGGSGRGNGGGSSSDRYRMTPVIRVASVQ